MTDQRINLDVDPELIPAKYTEVLANVVNYWRVNLFDFDYTLYGNDTPPVKGMSKAELQELFVNHFYFREIGEETIDRFKTHLRMKWLEVLPKYNMLFAAYYELNPQKDAFINDNFTTEGKSIYNDTPKNTIDFDNSHASAITTVNNTNSGLRGKSKFRAVTDAADELRNPYVDFVEEFNDLFFGIY